MYGPTSAVQTVRHFSQIFHPSWTIGQNILWTSLAWTTLSRNEHFFAFPNNKFIQNLIERLLNPLSSWIVAKQQGLIESHQKFGNIEAQHYIENFTSSSSVAGSRANCHKISAMQTSLPCTKKSDSFNCWGITLLFIAGKILTRILLTRLISIIAEEHFPKNSVALKPTGA